MFAQNIYCGYTLKPPRRRGSHAYPQSLFWNKKKKKKEKKNKYTPVNPSFAL